MKDHQPNLHRMHKHPSPLNAALKIHGQRRLIRKHRAVIKRAFFQQAQNRSGRPVISQLNTDMNNSQSLATFTPLQPIRYRVHPFSSQSLPTTSKRTVVQAEIVL